MNLMFWKKKAETAGDTEGAQEQPADSDNEAEVKIGLAARIKMQLAALVRRFKGKPAFSAGEEPEPDAHGHSESDSGDESQTSPVNLKKRLIIGGAAGLLVLLLGGIVFAVLKMFMSPAPPAEVPAVAETPHDVRSAPHAEMPSAEIEALRKKNLELQTQIEVLKKEPVPPPPSAEPAGQQPGNASVLPPSESGELTINNQDPKAAAMSLKEAIDAMNESAGDYSTKKKAK